MTMSNTRGDDYAELKVELQETRAKLKKVEAKLERGRRRRRRLALWGFGKLAGPELHSSSRAWVAKLRERPGDLATDESADLLAALARRMLRIGVFGLLVGAFAILTPFVTLWQTFEIRKQVEQQAEQNALQAEQNALQAADTRIVRRAQLLATIYGEECQPVEGESVNRARICTPRSHIRAREEAVRAFVEIERTQGVNANLRNANLQGADLFEANLQGVDLLEANLQGADLTAANLQGAQLFKADLQGAELFHANLRGANLNAANLSGAYLTVADLREANLSFANLRDAQLDQANLSSADLSHSNLRRAILNRAVLDRANLWGRSSSARTSAVQSISCNCNWILVAAVIQRQSSRRAWAVLGTGVGIFRTSAARSACVTTQRPRSRRA